MSDPTHDLESAFGPILLREQVGDTDFIVVALLYHVALYVNPTKDAGYDDRYCIHSLPVAARAIQKFRECGEVWYWQKHHNKRLRVSGCYVYRDNELCIPENALKCVEWDADLIRELGVDACSQNHSGEAGAFLPGRISLLMPDDLC